MKCWIKGTIILYAISLFLVFVVSKLFGAFFTVIAVSVVEALGFNLHNECTNPCKIKPLKDIAVTLTYIFWAFAYGLFGWLICRIKSFSKGQNT